MTALRVENLGVVRTGAVAAAMLDSSRLGLLAELSTPASASQLAQRLGQPRQRVNYHLRALEKAGLVRLVEERKKGNCVERLVVATATSYLISPEALGALGSEPGKVADRASSAYLVAVAADAIRELGVLRDRARAAGKKLATMSLLTQVRLESAESMNRFAEELATAVAQVAAKYHRGEEAAPAGRTFKVFVGSYPAITKEPPAAAGGAEASP
jgi:DNA-binding transcriptional ArsR family regulator